VKKAKLSLKEVMEAHRVHETSRQGDRRIKFNIRELPLSVLYKI
jgi:hypothetical protein